MAVLSRDDFFSAVQQIVGTDTSETAIAFIENMTDTYNALANNDNNAEWEQRYNDLNKQWAEKYKHRFFSGDTSQISPQNEPTSVENDDNIKIDDLFD